MPTKIAQIHRHSAKRDEAVVTLLDAATERRVNCYLGRLGTPP